MNRSTELMVRRSVGSGLTLTSSVLRRSSSSSKGTMVLAATSAPAFLAYSWRRWPAESNF